MYTVSLRHYVDPEIWYCQAQSLCHVRSDTELRGVTTFVSTNLQWCDNNYYMSSKKQTRWFPWWKSRSPYVLLSWRVQKVAFKHCIAVFVICFDEIYVHDGHTRHCMWHREYEFGYTLEGRTNLFCISVTSRPTAACITHDILKNKTVSTRWCAAHVRLRAERGVTCTQHVYVLTFNRTFRQTHLIHKYKSGYVS